MVITKWILIGLIMGALLASQGANAQPPMSEKPSKWHHEKMEKRIQDIYSQLNLTAEQKKMLDENKGHHRGQRKASFEKMKSYKDTLHQELMKPELDMGKIQQIHSQMKVFQNQMADDRLNSILEVRKILTAEQFTKFISLMKGQKSEKVSVEDK